MVESTTLLACNKRYIVSAQGDRISTRRTNETLSLLKPDYLGHKGTVTHLAIHQPDHSHGTQDDWGRVVASSDATNHVKVWLCDGEEEELLFARNMAEYIGYEKVTALAWTGDSKVAIGDTSGNFIVFNARYATSRYNRTVSKPITAIAPSHNDPHIHAVGYDDGSIILIRTNPSFQILFTNTVAHTSPIVSLAWRPEFSAPRTYTEKDGKVHKSNPEDMALLASCPATKGQFRIWAWSTKNEKLNGFRDEKNDGNGPGEAQPGSSLQWSRNGKVVQYIEGEIRIWDVKKLQIQSELFIPASEGVIGVAVDGHRGFLYTLKSDGQVEKHVIPTKSASRDTSTPLPPSTPALEVPVSIESDRASTPEPQSSTSDGHHSDTKEVHERTPERKLSIPESRERSASQTSIDSLSRVKQMAKQFDEDSSNKKKNNFIASAKAKYSLERRKRTASTESELSNPHSRSTSPDPSKILESAPTQRSVSAGSQIPRQPSLFDIAVSRIPTPENAVSRRQERSLELKTSNSSLRSQRDESSTPQKTIVEATPSVIPTQIPTLAPPQSKETREIALPRPNPVLKPAERPPRETNPAPLSVEIPVDHHQSSSSPDQSITLDESPSKIPRPIANRLSRDTADFMESPILGEAILSDQLSSATYQTSLPEPILAASNGMDIASTIPIGFISGPLHTIPEENISPSNLSFESPVLPLQTHTFSEADDKEQAQTMNTPPQTTVTASGSFEGRATPSSSSSSSSKLAEPTSSYEDLGGISMDDIDIHGDARSDTSVEPMDDTKPLPPAPVEHIDDPTRPLTPKTEGENEVRSPVIKSSPGSRASRIWAEKNGTNIYTQIITSSDGEEETPSPAFQQEKPNGKVDDEITLDDPTPYRHSLRDYNLFRNLTKQMARQSKELLDGIMSTRLTQRNICKAFFGYDNIRILVQKEMQYAREQAIDLTELVFKLWLGLDIDDETLLKALIFGKNNGLSDSLVLSLAPLAGMESWESLMLWCTETQSSSKGLPETDVVIGNVLVRTHLYAGFLFYNGSLEQAIGVYRKAEMFREAILMSLMALLVVDDNKEESLVETVRELFRSWADQIAAHDGDGLLVSMCFAANLMVYDPAVRPRRPSVANSSSSRASSPSPEHLRPRQGSDTPNRSASPSIPVIRTQKPSPQDPLPRKPGSQGSQDSNGGRNWAELASFMRAQRDRRYNEIRTPKGVHFKDSDSLPSSGRSTPSLRRPSYPSDRSRSNSPSSMRGYHPNRYIDDEDWSRPPRASPRKYSTGHDDMEHKGRPRRPNLATSAGSPDLKSHALEPPQKRRGHDIPSPLSFGARGAHVKPNGGATPEAPPLPIKDEKRDKRRMRLPEDRKRDGGHEIGLGIQNYGIKEHATRVL